MQINGHEYRFAYTVGAYCSIADLKLDPPKTLADQCKITRQMAVIMSKEYEDKQRLVDPSYKCRYLTLAEVNAMSIQDVVEGLMPEIDSAVAEGQYRTVETKKDKGADRE